MPKHEEISRWVREKIAGGTYSEQSRLPTEKELAQQFECSRETVRHAMGNLEAEGILSRIRGNGTYVRKQGKSGKTDAKQIAILLSHTQEMGILSMLEGAENVLSDGGYSMLLGMTKGCPVKEEECLRRMQADGIIIESAKTAFPNANRMLYQQLKREKMPMVFLNGFFQKTEAKGWSAEGRELAVEADEVRAGEMAAETLIAGGHERIGVILRSDEARSRMRLDGLCRAAQRNGIFVPERAVFWYSAEEAPDMMEENSDLKMWMSASKVTGFACQSDVFLPVFIKEVQEKYRHSELSAVIFGEPYPKGVLPQGFAFVAPPYEKMGRLAAEMILKKQTDPTYVERIVLPPKIWNP